MSAGTRTSMARVWPIGPEMSTELGGTSEPKSNGYPEMGLGILPLVDILGVALMYCQAASAVGGGQAIRCIRKRQLLSSTQCWLSHFLVPNPKPHLTSDTSGDSWALG